MKLPGRLVSMLFVALMGAFSPRPAAATPTRTALPVLRIVGYITPNSLLAKSLDPVHATFPADQWVVNAVDQGLVGLDEHGRVIKELASTITVSPDRKRYIFTLRRAAFTNGDPITAGVVAASLKRLLAPSTASILAYYDRKGYADIVGADAFNRGTSQKLTGVRVLGTRRLEIDITRPIASFLTILASSANDIVDPAVAARGPVTVTGNIFTTDCPAARDNASGPFTFQCSGTSFFPPGTNPHYTLVPNPRYSGPSGRPHIRIGVQRTSTIADAQSMFAAGQTDAVPTEVPQAAPARHLRWSGSTVAWLAFNVVDPPFNDLHCRLAVAYGLNRAAFDGGAARATRRIVPRGILPYSTRADPHYDPARERKEMAKCPGGSDSVLFADMPPFTEPLLLAFSAIGFSKASAYFCTSVFCQDPDVESLHATRMQAAIRWWTMDYPDPRDYLPLFTSGSQYNIGGVHDPTFDRLVKRAGTDADPNGRARLYQQAEHRLLAHAAAVPLVLQQFIWTVSPEVTGLTGGTATGGFPAPAGEDWSRVAVR